MLKCRFKHKCSHTFDAKILNSGKTWAEKKNLVQSMSAFGHLPGWTLKSFIVKAGDDLRKEVLAMQLIGMNIRKYEYEICKCI
jgi:hypothetical protein